MVGRARKLRKQKCQSDETSKPPLECLICCRDKCICKCVWKNKPRRPYMRSKAQIDEDMLNFISEYRARALNLIKCNEQNDAKDANKNDHSEFKVPEPAKRIRRIAYHKTNVGPARIIGMNNMKS